MRRYIEMIEDITYEEIKKGALTGKEFSEEFKKSHEEQGIYQDKKLPEPKESRYDKALIIIQAWELQEEFDNLKNEKIHKIDSNSPSFLFYVYKHFHPRSTINIESFLFGFVLIVAEKVIEGKRARLDWTLAQKVMFEVTDDARWIADEYLDPGKPAKRKKRMARYRMGLRAVKIVFRAWLDLVHRSDDLVLSLRLRYLWEEKKKEIKSETLLMYKIFMFIWAGEGEVTHAKLSGRFQQSEGKKLHFEDLIPFLDVLVRHDIIFWDFDRRKIGINPAFKKWMIGEKRSSGPDHIQEMKAVSPTSI